MTLMPWVLYSFLLQMASSLDAAEFTTFISGFSCVEGFSNNWSGSANSEVSNGGVTTYPGLMAHFLHAGTHGTNWQLSPAECNLQCFSIPGIGTHTALINFPTNTLTSDRTCRCYSAAQMAQISIDPVSTGEGFYFCLAALATPSPPIDATVNSQGSFCIDACCPETAIPKLIFGPDDRFGDGITVLQNNSKLTCSGVFEATDVRIAGTSTTVADLIGEVASLRAWQDSTIEALQMAGRLNQPNLVQDGEFQCAQLPCGWSTDGPHGADDPSDPASVAIVETNWQFPGDQAVQVVKTGGGIAGIEKRNVSVVPGRDYTASVFFNLISIAGTVDIGASHPIYVRLFEWDSGLYINEIRIGAVHAGRGWTYAEKKFTVPDNTNRLGIGLYMRQMGMSFCSNCTVTVQFDKVSLVQHVRAYQQCKSDSACAKNE